MPHYTKEELDILKSGYADPYISVEIIGKQLNRNPTLIRIKARKLGIKKVRKHHSISGYKCSSCGSELIKDENWIPSYYSRERYTCKKCVRKQTNIRTKMLRQEVIHKLGEICKNCGYSGIAIQIDHIHGGGNKEVKKFKTRMKYYEYILSLSDKDRNEKYQPLCANCNWEKRIINGELPFGL